MTRTSRSGTLGLLARHASAEIVSSVLVAVLVAAAVFAAAIAPRALVRLGSEELQYTLAGLSPGQRDLRGLGRLGLFDEELGSADPLAATDDAITAIPDRLPEPLRALTGEPEWVVRAATSDAEIVGAVDPPRFIADLAVSPGFTDRVAYVSGVEPAPRPQGDAGPLPVSLSRAAADALSIEVGDEFVGEWGSLRVSGIYEPRDPDAGFWGQAPDLAEPSISALPGVVPTVHAPAVIAAGSVSGLADSFRNGQLVAWIPIDTSRVRYSDAPTITMQARAAFAADVRLPAEGVLAVNSRFADAVDVIVARVVTASALLALSLSGLGGVLLAVFAMGVAAIVARRRALIDLATARGASGLQVRAAAAIEGLVIALPTAALALGAAVALIPDAAGPEGWTLPVAVALAVPALFAGIAVPPAVRRSRPRTRGRLALEIAVVALAGVAVFLLFRRGIGDAGASPAGVDPLLALAPVLLAAAVCVVTLRLLPAVLGLLLRRVRRGDGAGSLVGASYAVRAPALGVAATFALILGVTVVVFSAVMGSTIRDGVLTGAREQVGADVQVSAAALDPALAGEVEKAAGVAAASAVQDIPGAKVKDVIRTTGVNVIVADTVALHAVRPDLPVLTRASGASAPVAISTDLDGRLDLDSLALSDARVDVVASISPSALPGATRNVVLIDVRDAAELGRGDFRPQHLLVALDGSVPPAAATTAIERIVGEARSDTTRGDVSVVSAEQIRENLRSSPVIGGLERIQGVAAGAALLLAIAALVLATASARRRRTHLLAVLGAIGADRRQQRRALAWQFAPGVIAALLVGILLGLALPYVVTAAVDLRPFVGGRVPPSPVVDVGMLAVGIGGFAVVAGVASVLTGRRRAPAASLKMGER